MVQTEQVKKLIEDALSCEELHILGDGDQFEALVVSALFAGKSRVQRQQMVNAVLKPYFDSGELHAFSMKTVTPEEWRALRG